MKAREPPRPTPQEQRADAALLLQALTITGPIPTATVAARLGLTRLEATALLLCMEGRRTEGELIVSVPEGKPMTAITMPAILRGLFRFRPEPPTRRFLISCEASGMTWAVHAGSYPALYQAIGQAVYGVTSTPVLLALARGGWDHGQGAYGPVLSIAEVE